MLMQENIMRQVTRRNNKYNTGGGGGFNTSKMPTYGIFSNLIAKPNNNSNSNDGYGNNNELLHVLHESLFGTYGSTASASSPESFAARGGGELGGGSGEAGSGSSSSGASSSGGIWKSHFAATSKGQQQNQQQQQLLQQQQAANTERTTPPNRSNSNGDVWGGSYEGTCSGSSPRSSYFKNWGSHMQSNNAASSGSNGDGGYGNNGSGDGNGGGSRSGNLFDDERRYWRDAPEDNEYRGGYAMRAASVSWQSMHNNSLPSSHSSQQQLAGVQQQRQQIAGVQRQHSAHQH
jgi:hypothetical protein